MTALYDKCSSQCVRVCDRVIVLHAIESARNHSLEYSVTARTLHRLPRMAWNCILLLAYSLSEKYKYEKMLNMFVICYNSKVMYNVIDKIKILEKILTDS